MIIPGHILRQMQPVKPFSERTRYKGFTYGVGPAGYDLRVDQEFVMRPGDFRLCSAMEEFDMPLDVLGIVHDKSTWARLGIAAQNTVIEPGWRGFLTLELSNHGIKTVTIPKGVGIVQVLFHRLEEPAPEMYSGKYQGQKRGPQPAIIEEDDE